MKTANVALAHSDLQRLITELDARAHDLRRFADAALRHRDARQASAHHEHREEVLRLREYLHLCLRTLTARDADARPD